MAEGEYICGSEPKLKYNRSLFGYSHEVNVKRCRGFVGFLFIHL